MSTIRSVLNAPKRYLPALIGVAALVADQVSKIQVRKHLPKNVINCVAEKLVCLQHREFPVSSYWRSSPFSFSLLIAMHVALVSTAIVFCAKAKDKINKIAFALLASGIAGNAVDRILYNQVTDFILTAPSLWPYTYNVADVGLVAGVTLLGYRHLFPKKNLK